MRLVPAAALGALILPALIAGAAIDKGDADAAEEAPAYV